MISSHIASILRSIRELGTPVHVSGIQGSARAFTLSRMALEREVPLVVFCPSDELAQEMMSDLEALSGGVLGRIPQITHFPTWDPAPYSPITPSLRTRLDRLAALQAVRGSNSGPLIIFTTPAGFCQATLPVAQFEKHAIVLRTEESVESREALVARLLAAGYLRVDPVEDPGSFAVRGDIVDVYPPGADHPIRIELYGDLIERLRPFDSSTQKALGDTKGQREVTLPPAREVLLTPDALATLRENIKSRADDLGIQRNRRDPILAMLSDGVYPDHADAWVPFTYANPSTLLDYLPPQAEFAWVDELGTLQRWDDQQREMREAAEGLKSEPEGILPEPSALFHWTPELERRVRQNSRLYLDQVVMANLSSVEKEEAEAAAPAQEADSPRENHRVALKGNADLSPGGKPDFELMDSKLRLWQRQGFKILILTSTASQADRIRFLLEERGLTVHREGTPQPGLISLQEGRLTEGFRWPAEGLVVITDSEILGTRKAKTGRSRAHAKGESTNAQDWAGLQNLADLQVGDAVVHVDHGIGRYQGLVRLELLGAANDFLQLEYANKDKLYLPIYRLNVVQKYVGDSSTVTLDRLGSQYFAKTKEKVKDAVRKLAVDLVKLYAERKIRPGVVFSPRDEQFREFEDRFPYEETPDQLRAIDAVLADMESGRVSDRLVCGDVGYGKTEVAIRAAFRAVSDGKQVAVLVPTTILAHQHEQNFKSRLRDYPIRIESLSRFKSPKQQKEIIEGVKSGKVDILIGTHRLLSRDLNFKDLGIIIVDEEHRFGVEHKEKLKVLRSNIHCLTLTATPIPRTLHMALSGLRDISLINTPPVDRLPIRTYVSRYDDELIKRSIEFELGRGGQVFFLHNRVQSIHEIANRIRELVPQARIGIGHGQMGEKELEEAMLAFYEKRTNVLVCTAIIESGIDLPSANTILINRADTLGLAQLYQIRGRVGRGQVRAYAYLLIPSEGAVTEDAKKRLEVIQRFVELGSGFHIASHDLEIRGGGDILGPQQSGNIAAVGFDLYMELLDEAIQELQGKPLEPEASQREPEIKAPYSAYLSESYVPDVHQRLALYRRLSGTTEEQQILDIEQEMRDRYGTIPTEGMNLLWLIRLKQLLKRNGVDAITVGPDKVVLSGGPYSKLDPTRAVALAAGNRAHYQLLPDGRFVAKAPTAELKDLTLNLESLLKKLVI